MTAEQQEAGSKPQMRIHIDQHQYESPNPTTGTSLYALGGVPPGFELYHEVRGDREDPPIERGPEVIHLREDEHFHSAPAPNKHFTIFVNGQKKVVETAALSFEDLVALAFNPIPSGPNVVFTITYDRGPRENPSGTLMPGQSVHIKNGMIFNVTPTDKS